MKKNNLNAFKKDKKFKLIQDYCNFNDFSDYIQDFGHIISNSPAGIFQPPTIKILQHFLQLINKHKIAITCRGKGHSVYGQSQIKNGIIVDLNKMRKLLKFNFTESASILVSASETWLNVMEIIKKKNKTIPVIIDYFNLTVGGTISSGGIGGTSYRYGTCADNIISLGVLTMDGKYHVCSEEKNNELFNAVLCGLGQFGIIITASIPLIPAKRQVNRHSLSYNNAEQFLQDQKTLYHKKIFDYLKDTINKKKWRMVVHY